MPRDESETIRIRKKIESDIESGIIDKLTFSVGRKYGLKSDGQVRQVQRQLMKSGHLNKVGKQFKAV